MDAQHCRVYVAQAGSSELVPYEAQTWQRPLKPKTKALHDALVSAESCRSWSLDLTRGGDLPIQSLNLVNKLGVYGLTSSGGVARPQDVYPVDKLLTS